MQPGIRRDANDEVQDLRLLSRPVALQALPADRYGAGNRAAVASGRSGLAAVDDSDRSFAKSPIGWRGSRRSGASVWSGGRRTSATAGVTPPRRVTCGARRAEANPCGRIPCTPHRDPQPHDAYTEAMTRLHRITQDPDVMGGRPCIRGLRVTVATIVGLLAAGHDADEVLAAYPYLERDDISQALTYAAWRT